jgi:hypothetical protein
MSADPVNSSDEAIEAAAHAVEARIRSYGDTAGSLGLPHTGSIGWGATPAEIAEAALTAAEPFIAARVRAEALKPVTPPADRVDVEWLGLFTSTGGTRYVPGECLCGPVEAAA